MPIVFRCDPCGISCILITYGAFMYADYVVVSHLLVPNMSGTLWGAVNAVLFNLIILLGILSHWKAVSTDPGMVPLPKTSLDFSDIPISQLKNMRNEYGWTVCVKCETYRPPRAHHCRICRRCIRRMDHHCPWINNCVGELNQKHFIQFLFYVGMSSAYAVCLVVAIWVIYPLPNHSPLKEPRMIHSILLVVESLLFGLFVIAIGCDQIQAILGDETGIEHIQKKGPHRSKRSNAALLAEVFGRGPQWKWLFPYRLSSSSPPEHSTDYVV